MNKPRGWRYESQRHSLAARGIPTTMRSQGMIRAYKPLLSGRIKSLRTEEQDTLTILYDMAYEVMDRNDWSKGKALKDLDYDYGRLKLIYEQTGDPDIKYQMEINENVQSLVGFTSPKEIQNWPNIRDEKIEKYLDDLDANGIKTRLGQSGKHLYYFFFGMGHPYSLSTFVNKANNHKVRDLREESLSQAGGSPTGAFDLIYDRHKQLLNEYYGTEDPIVRKSLEEPMGVSVTAMWQLSSEAMME